VLVVTEGAAMALGDMGGEKEQLAPASPVLAWHGATRVDRDLLMPKTSGVVLGPGQPGLPSYLRGRRL